MNTSIFLISLVTSLFANCVQYVKGNFVITENVFNEIKSKLGLSELYDVKSFWKTPEICEWDESMIRSAVQNNICNTVAVKLYENKLFPASMSPTQIKQFIPYKCNDKIAPVKNNSVMFCPPLTIQITGSKQIQINGFFIGKGNHRVNSIFVYDMQKDIENNLNIIGYMYNILNCMTMRIRKEEYLLKIKEQKKRKFTFLGRTEAIFNLEKQIKTSGVEKVAENSDIMCKADVKTLIDMCRDLSIGRFEARSNKRDLLVKQMQGLDAWGFIPYSCVKRPFNLKQQSASFSFKLNLIYCPDTMIIDTEKEEKFSQASFLYGAGSRKSLFIFGIDSKNTNDQADRITSIYVKDQVIWETEEKTLTSTGKMEADLDQDFDQGSNINETEAGITMAATITMQQDFTNGECSTDGCNGEGICAYGYHL